MKKEFNEWFNEYCKLHMMDDAQKSEIKHFCFMSWMEGFECCERKMRVKTNILLERFGI